MCDLKTVRVFRTLAGKGRVGLLGTAVRASDGWRFVPNVFGHSRSRRAWHSWEACLPRWVGYPNACETEAVTRE
jgi:hypothetical protein